MKQPSHLLRRLKRVAGITLAATLFLGTLPETANATFTSTWNPTLLVNTESFQVIDAGDGTTNIELKFGTNLDARLFYDITNARFNFTKSVFVQGSLTATGAITAKGTLSGQTLIVSGVSSFSGASVFKTNATVKGTLSGTTLRVSGNADINGVLGASGAIRTDSNSITINNKNNSTDDTLTFGNATTAGTLKYLNAGQKFQFSKMLSVIGVLSGSTIRVDQNADIFGKTTTQTLTVTGTTILNGNVGVGTTNPLAKLEVHGTVSGSNLIVANNAVISGSVIVKNNIAAKGTVSGSTITGFGLGSCNGANQRLLYNTATSKFECSTIAASPTTFGTGNVIAINNNYVKKAGDTMTGALTISVLNGGAGTLGLKVVNTLTGAIIHAEKSLTSSGTVFANGNITTKANLTINGDSDTNNAVLTFGNNTADQSITYNNANQRFEFSKNVKVQGSISGATLTVDGNVTLHGVTYNAPSAQGAANSVLKNDGAGNLTWATSVGNSSGDVLSLHPQYPNSVLFGSGSSYVGTLAASGSTVLNENFYYWTTTKATLQNYWISVRVRLPLNFVAWDPLRPIELRYRTADGTNTNNHVVVRMKDTGNNVIALTGAGQTNGGLASASFTTATITGPETTGTYTAGGYITVYVKMSSVTGKFAEAGFLNLNFKTTTP